MSQTGCKPTITRVCGSICCVLYSRVPVRCIVARKQHTICGGCGDDEQRRGLLQPSNKYGEVIFDVRCSTVTARMNVDQND